MRLFNLIKYGIIQTRVLRQKYPGIMHVALAWSFFIFFLGTALATINTHFVKFLVGPVFSIYKLTLDVFTLVFIIGAGLALYRRYISKPDRLTYNAQFTWTLVLLLIIVLGGITTESLRLAVEQPVNRPLVSGRLEARPSIYCIWSLRSSINQSASDHLADSSVYSSNHNHNFTGRVPAPCSHWSYEYLFC